MNNFWKELNQPIMALAPMEDVTDTAFRELVMRISQPGRLHILYTEFTSTDGLCHETGRENVIKRFKISESERYWLNRTNTRIVAQIWGTDPEKFRKAAAFITREMDFDGIDINMGCPVKKIIKTGACSALIGQPALAKEIVYATKEGTPLPVSVKTRTGLKEHQTETWMRHLLETRPAAIILHGRTQKNETEVPADWNQLGIAAQVRNALHPEIPLLGNGDLQSLEEAREKIKQYGIEGAMVGRGIFWNPWFFNPGHQPDIAERLDTLLLHTRLFSEYWNHTRNFSVLRRFYKIYIQGFPGAARLRAELMTTHNQNEVKKLIENFKKQIKLPSEIPNQNFHKSI
jgi:nifR3 family TIM-barrel protein